ncbi:MAG: M23 family metallopeptidase [Firmicutes bacterium]|nr:M23 family metallopeptidase [Bacillota bacterium]
MVFTLPVKTGSLGLDYSATDFVWLSTQQRLQVHKAIDFIAPAGTNVYAAFDGTIKSIKTNVIYGTVITISHQDGVDTVYKSLDSNTKVRVGDTVKTGDIIGYVSDSMMYEVAEGPHLHFEVWKSGKIIDPYTYLASLEK